MFNKDHDYKKIFLLNNIVIIDNFLISEGYDKLIINQVSDEIGIFYKNIILCFCEKKRIKVVYSDGSEIIETNDLFKEQTLKLCITNSSKIIENILSKKEKYVLITDYKIFKKYSKRLSSVNGYNYESDIKFYLQNNLKISNLDVLKYCISSPQLAFSEISKFLVNSDGYVKEAKINEKSNFILELRKELFNLKRKGSDIKIIYENIKNEAKYKKFNFLTF